MRGIATSNFVTSSFKARFTARAVKNLCPFTTRAQAKAARVFLCFKVDEGGMDPVLLTLSLSGRMQCLCRASAISHDFSMGRAAKKRCAGAERCRTRLRWLMGLGQLITHVLSKGLPEHIEVQGSIHIYIYIYIHLPAKRDFPNGVPKNTKEHPKNRNILSLCCAIKPLVVDSRSKFKDAPLGVTRTRLAASDCFRKKKSAQTHNGGHNNLSRREAGLKKCGNMREPFKPFRVASMVVEQRSPHTAV